MHLRRSRTAPARSPDRRRARRGGSSLPARPGTRSSWLPSWPFRYARRPSESTPASVSLLGTRATSQALIPAHSASLRAFAPVFEGLWTRVNALMLGIQGPRTGALGPRNGIPATRASRGAPREDERRDSPEPTTGLVFAARGLRAPAQAPRPCRRRAA